MVNHSKLYSLDNETLDYIESIPKKERSKTVREALKLHKYRHRDEKIIQNEQEIKKIKVKIIG